MTVRYPGSGRIACAAAPRWRVPLAGTGFVDEQARGVLLAALAVAGASVVVLQDGPPLSVAGLLRYRAEQAFDRPFPALDVPQPARRPVATGATLTIPLDDPLPVAGAQRPRVTPVPRRAPTPGRTTPAARPADAVAPPPVVLTPIAPPADVDRRTDAMPPPAPDVPLADPTPPPAAAPSPPGPVPHYAQTARGIAFTVQARINGRPFGPIELLIEGSDLEHPERISGEISVRLGAIVDLLRANLGPDAVDLPMSADQLARYVTLNELRAHGIAASFDAADRLNLRTG